nr:ubiquitin-like protein Pup [Angustibacter aerolatus]
MARGRSGADASPAARGRARRRPRPAAPQGAATKEGLDDDIDSVLDEIDEVLEANAEDFVRALCRKGVNDRYDPIRTEGLSSVRRRPSLVGLRAQLLTAGRSGGVLPAVLPRDPCRLLPTSSGRRGQDGPRGARRAGRDPVVSGLQGLPAAHGLRCQPLDRVGAGRLLQAASARPRHREPAARPRWQSALPPEAAVRDLGGAGRPDARGTLGTCPICRRSLGERPHVDHDHVSGAVRGLLCFTCNAGLGNFADDVARLRRAIEYVEGTLEAPSPAPDGSLVTDRRWAPPHPRAGEPAKQPWTLPDGRPTAPDDGGLLARLRAEARSGVGAGG